MNTRTLAKVNNVSIVLTSDENNRKLIPIRPICDALGIDYATQFTKLKEDEELAPTIGLSPTVALMEKTGKWYVCLTNLFSVGFLRLIRKT